MRLKVINALLFLASVQVLNPRALASESPREKIEDSSEGYVTAMESFDVRSDGNFNSSCWEIASAIKALTLSSGTEAQREYATCLFVYAKFRPDLFPEAQLRVPSGFYYSGSKKVQKYTDVVIQRSDGTFFVFQSDYGAPHKYALENLQCITSRNESGLFYRGFTHPVARSVIIGIEFLRQAQLRFFFLLDPKVPESAQSSSDEAQKIIEKDIQRALVIEM